MRTNNFRAVACAVLCAALAFAPARADEKKPPAEKTVSIHFTRMPWADVLDWYAKETGLTLISTVKPVGPLTFRPGKHRKFTMPEVTDLLNEALAQQHLMLLPNRKSFTVISTAEKINPKLVAAVELKDLPRFGRSVIVEVAIPLPPELKAEDAGDLPHEKWTRS